MKPLLWFILGALVMMSGQAIAQMSIWQDNHGHSGTIYTPQRQQQPDYNAPAAGMGQQLQGILQSQRNPC